MEQQLAQSKLDKTGMWVTTVCAIHCLLLPLILPLLSVIGLSFIGEDLLENTVLSFSIAIGLLALFMGARKHKKWWLMLLLLGGAVIYSNRDIFGPWGEPVIILLGAGMIIYAHWVNLRWSLRLRAQHTSTAAPSE
ncbi:MerC domain-containing protein [Idiomarina tyrosinivorans]|uniref:MerC domain-containing protein n=1 Tax=Idiomarina tyrosinivorans TaxID=1445662 RepID=A0A432ZFF6_9GAMM|nr:MerC domain-containing protein [Idiomarina tyrosinivorans]RUO76620.1 MerC domain-containing protein [Idiomarina tyrosinivorans]